MTSNDIQKQLAKLRRDKKLLWLGVLFFVMVVVWILSSIFTVTKTSSITPELRELAKSFVPRLESKVFDEILEKRTFTDDELSSFSIYIFDKKNIEDSSVLIDIIEPSGESVAAEGTVPILMEEPSDGAASGSASGSDGGSQNGVPFNIPLENIIGPQ